MCSDSWLPYLTLIFQMFHFRFYNHENAAIMARLLDGYFYVYFRMYTHWSGDKYLVYNAPSPAFLTKFEMLMDNHEFTHFSSLKKDILNSKLFSLPTKK